MALRVGKIAKIGENLNTSQDQLLAAIARSAEELTSGRGWPEGVLNLMEDLGKITKVSRVWIFQVIDLKDDYIIQDYPFEWADEVGHAQLHMSRFNMFRSELANPTYRQMIESRKRGEWQSVITSDLPKGVLKNDLIRQNISSMLTIPIMIDETWWGTLGFDDCKREYRWSDVEIALLRTASYLISNAIIRDRLSAKTHQFNILKSITESSAWELDLRDGHFWCSSDIIGKVGGLGENVHMTLREMLRLVHSDDVSPLLNAFRSYVQDPSGTFRMDLRVVIDCGMFVWIEVIGGLTRDSTNKPLKFAGIAVEILERKKHEEDLQLQVRRDPLTGAGNRSKFDQDFSRMLNNVDREYSCFALLLADLDHFKRVNDRWGHKAGDKALKQFAHTCFKFLRHSDSFCRIGGEEFAFLLPDVDREAAQAVGERIRSEVETTALFYQNEYINITVSLGCVVYRNEQNLSRNKLFQLADDALYNAKRTGRNRLICAEKM